MYVVMFGLHMLERYVFIALAYMGKRMLMHSVVACRCGDRESPPKRFVVIGRATGFYLVRYVVIGRAMGCGDRESPL